MRLRRARFLPGSSERRKAHAIAMARNLVWPPVYVYHIQFRGLRKADSEVPEANHSKPRATTSNKDLRNTIMNGPCSSRGPAGKTDVAIHVAAR